MKEHPILFQGAMVRALLDGSKTQTRRVCNAQPFDRSYSKHDHRMDYVSGRAENGDEIDGFYAYSTSGGGQWQLKCPYGQPGDRLWVRETWLEDPADDGTWAYTQYMGCKGSPLSDIPKRFQKPEHCIFRADWNGPDLVWRPSIHMPRWASRILLEVASVRVERLNDCSESDARAEGIKARAVRSGVAMAPVTVYGLGTDNDWCSSAAQAYEELWESINGADSWATNPWVWVVEFRRLP